MSATDPIMAHLLDISCDKASTGLILAGGYGLRLKQNHLRATGQQILIAGVPDARPTLDLDFFLSISFFQPRTRRHDIRALLDRLGYEELEPHLQFVGRNLGPESANRRIKVDLLARLPTADESEVKVKAPRVGARSGIGLHGRETPEAFAVEDQPVTISIAGNDTKGVHREAIILVPHPYSWINMKVKAAYDWLLRKRGQLEPKEYCEKHVLDVYLLIAMLTEAEIATCRTLAVKYAATDSAADIKQNAAELYAAPNGSGSLEASRLVGSRIQHPIFWEALRAVLGID